MSVCFPKRCLRPDTLKSREGVGRPVQNSEIGEDKPRKLRKACLVKLFGASVVTDRENGVQTWTIDSMAANHQLEKKTRNMGDADRLLSGRMEKISDLERTSGCTYTGALELDINTLPLVVTPVDVIGESHKVLEDLCGDLKAQNYSPCYDLQQGTQELRLLTDEPATSAADVVLAEPAAEKAPKCAPGDADLATAGKSRAGGEHYDRVWVDMFREEEEVATAALPSPPGQRRFAFPLFLRTGSDSLSSHRYPPSSNSSTPSPSPRTALSSPLSREPAGASHPFPSEGSVRWFCLMACRKGQEVAGSVGRHTGMGSLGRGMGLAWNKEMVAGSVGRHTGKGSLGRGMGLAWKKEMQKETQIVVTLEKRGVSPTADVAPSAEVATKMQSQDSSILGVPKSETKSPMVSPRGHFRRLSQEEVVYRATRIGEAE